MVQEWKLKKVDELAAKIDSTPVVGLIDLSGLGADQLQKIKKDTRAGAEIIVTKKTIIMRALDKSKKANMKEFNNDEKYKPHIPALMLSKDNAFKLYRHLENSKSQTFAKAGDKSPRDIIIPAGETSLAPGPVISELQKAGVKAMIQGPKISIREDSPLLKEGEIISDVKAGIMMKLDIRPMEVGLNLLGAHEGDIIFDKSTLAVDPKEYIAKLGTAYTQAINLGYNANIYNKEIIPLKIQEAFRNVINLAVNTEIPAKDTINLIIQKANAEMLSVASALPESARGSVTVTAQAAPQAHESKKAEPDKKDEKKTEEEAAAGLGSLFG